MSECLEEAPTKPSLWKAGAKKSESGGVANAPFGPAALGATASAKIESCTSRCIQSSKALMKVHHGSKQVFVDSDGAKADIKEHLGELREYDVADFYHKTGLFQAIATNAKFGSLTLVVITINSLWIGIEIDLNDAENLLDAEWYFQLGEFLFCAFFMFEWCSRFMAFRRKCDGLRDKWFCFDAFLVFIMVVETLILPFLMRAGEGDKVASTQEESDSGSSVNFSLLRMLRLLRLTRMVRFMRAMPELVILIKSINIAARPVLSTLGLLFIIIYMFAIVFKSQLDPQGNHLRWKFGKLSNSMCTLLVTGTFLDNVAKTSNFLMDESPLMTGVFVAFILLSSFTVLNLLIGMLCEVVSIVSSIEKERATVCWVKSKLLHVLEEIDEDDSGMISKEEFNKLILIPSAVNAMAELGVDVNNLVSLSDHIFSAAQIETETGSSSMSRSKKLSGNEALVADDLDMEPASQSMQTDMAGRETDEDPTKSSQLFQKLAKNNRVGEHTMGELQGDEDDEEEMAEISFADFIEMVIRLRSENHPSIMDLTDLRKLCLSTQHETLERMHDVEDTGEKLVNDLQNSVCNHPFYQLLSEHLQSRKSSHKRIHRQGSAADQPADVLRRRLEAASERRYSSGCSPDQGALSRAVSLADAVEVLGVVDACLDDDVFESLEAYDKKGNLRSPVGKHSPATPSTSSQLAFGASPKTSPRCPDTLALGRAFGTASSSSVLQEYLGPSGSSPGSPSRLPRMRGQESLDLTPRPPSRSADQDSSPRHFLSDSWGHGAHGSHLARSLNPDDRHEMQSPRSMSRESSPRLQDSFAPGPAIRGVLSGRCCSEDDTLHGEYTEDFSEPVTDRDRSRGGPQFSIPLVTTLPAIPAAAPDEDALEQALTLADLGEIASDSDVEI